MTAVVPRLAVVHCPQWPVAAAAGADPADPDEPVAVVRANRVVARSVAAGMAGVRVGQRRREAQSRCPQLRLVAHDPTADARAFHPVADAVSQLVPRLEVTRPGIITFATRGPSRYFGGDEAMAERVLAVVTEVLAGRLQAAGRPGVGIADGRFAAGVAARHAVRAAAGAHVPVEVVAPGGSPQFLAPLALRWLTDVTSGAGVGSGAEVSAEQVDLFRRLGITRLGELAALPPADVMARFGRIGAAAQRMAAGADERPPGTEDPPPGLAVVQQFDTPMPHLDAVVFAARQLAEQLVGALAERGRVCTQVAVAAETEHGERTERLWSLSAGFSTAAVVERVRWQLDGWASLSDDEPAVGTGAGVGGPPTAGVIQLCLEPTEVRADDGIQLGLWGGRTQADEWAQRAAARLAGLVGDEQVVVAERRGGRQPADAHRWVPASLSPLLDPSDRGARDARDAHDRVSGAPWPGSLPPPSPAEIHPEPVAADVHDAHGQPVSVSGRGVASGAPAVLCVDAVETPIVAWAGPWVIDERWWDVSRHRRLARFQLLTADGVAHLATIERRQWWLVARYG
jgi:protein ImuB